MPDAASPSPAAADPRRVYRDGRLQQLFAATLVAVIGVSGVTPAFPQVVRALAITPEEVGLLVTAYTVPGIVLTAPLGALADRVGRKRVLLAALGVYGLAGPACMLAPDFETLVAIRVVQGVGVAPIVALTITIIGELFDGARRTAAVGYNSAALNLGTAAAPALGGLVATLGWRWPFTLPLVALPVAAWLALRLHVPAPGDGAAEADADAPALAGVLRRADVLGLLGASVAFFVLLFGCYLTYLPAWLDGRLTSEAWVIGLVVASASAANGLAASQLERLDRLIPKRRLVGLAFAVCAGALALVPWAPSLPLLLVATSAFGGALGAGVTSILALLNELAPPRQRATLLAINATAIRVGQTLGPVAMGGVLALASVPTVFYAGAALAATAASVGLGAWEMAKGE
jgi:MFS family permease